MQDQRNLWLFRLLLSGVLLLLLAACEPSQPPPTPTLTSPAQTPVPTIQLLPTISPQAAATASPTPALPTATPSPAQPPTETLPPTPEATLRPLGYVAAGRGGLRLRSGPDANTDLLGNLQEFAVVTILGESEDGQWLQVSTMFGVVGWVWASYIERDPDLSADAIAATTTAVAAEVAAYQAPPTDQPALNVVSGVSGTARGIFLAGQGMGNRAAVFSKVGDSLTVATYVLYPIGWRSYDLGRYLYYEQVIQHFSGVIARAGQDSFANPSLAADNGWTTADVLDPTQADPDYCQGGESPLVCEYRVVRPAVALIMFGTNDVAYLSASAFRANLTQIVETTINMGIVPVLTTIPPRLGYETQAAAFSQIITETARSFDVPLLDYRTAVAPLPNGGLSDDGVHPSWPPGDYAQAAVFTEANLQYGYTMRNYTLLQALDAVWRGALY